MNQIRNGNILIGSRKAVSTILVQAKTLIDFDRNEYMIQETIIGLFKSGTFKKLPQLDYVLIATTYFQPGCQNCVLDDDEKKYYQVSLVYRHSRRIITHESKLLDEAMDLAQLLSRQLNLSLKDATIRGKAKWTHRLSNAS
jgi:hypothetical protein